MVDTAPVFVTAPDCHISHFIAQRCGDGGARGATSACLPLAGSSAAARCSRCARARAARRPAVQLAGWCTYLCVVGEGRRGELGSWMEIVIVDSHFIGARRAPDYLKYTFLGLREAPKKSKDL